MPWCNRFKKGPFFSSNPTSIYGFFSRFPQSLICNDVSEKTIFNSSDLFYIQIHDTIR
ncbi:hypothetical protein BC833DRAFT_610296 [Globomyces pollinis-pini]|nr:hypothetical protein BC833DRAFT_610296 [Globomyces pollinis-pini]